MSASRSLWGLSRITFLKRLPPRNAFITPANITRLLLLVMLAGCKALIAQSIKTEFDKSVDFSHFHTYSWREHPIFEKNPELVDQFSVARDLIRSAVNQGLAAKQYSRVDDSPDFLVTFFVTVKGMQDVRMVNTGWWYGWAPVWYPTWTEVTTSPYLEGTLFLDFVNAATNQLAWRAYCRTDIRDMKTRHESIEKAVKKALKKFPPKT